MSHTETATTASDALIQQARNIVADKFIEAETARGKSSQFATFSEWGRHLDDYSSFLRSGAYDDDLAVVSTLAALSSVSVEVAA